MTNLCEGGLQATVSVTLPSSAIQIETVDTPAEWTEVATFVNLPLLTQGGDGFFSFPRVITQAEVLEWTIYRIFIRSGNSLSFTLDTGATVTVAPGTDYDFASLPGGVPLGYGTQLTIDRVGSTLVPTQISYLIRFRRARFNGVLTGGNGATTITFPTQSPSPNIPYNLQCTYPSVRTNFFNGLFIIPNGRILGGYGIPTTINTTARTREEYRINNNPVPLFSGRISNMVLGTDETYYLNTFFNARRGKQQGFRFWCPFDNKMSHVKQGNLTQDPDTWTLGGILEEDGLSVTRIHPAKIYSSHGHVTKKPILLPKGTAKIYKDGIFHSEVTMNQYGELPYSGDTTGVTIDMEFDLPVWFDVDLMPSVLVGRTDEGEIIYKLSDLPIREKLVQLYSTNPLDEINSDLILSSTASLTSISLVVGPPPTYSAQSASVAEITTLESLNVNAITGGSVAEIVLQSVPLITLQVSPASVPEAAGAGIYTFTRSGSTATNLVVYFTVGGDAVFSTDYSQTGATTFTSSAGSITIPIGSSTAQITITAMDDAIVESTEVVELTLDADVTYSRITTTPVTLSILDNDGYVYVLDSISSTLYAAHSFRALLSSYTGPAIRVRRSSDNALQDINFVGGLLDTATMLTFIGASNGFVHTRYDITGNGRHSVQAGNTLQPQIVASGSLILRGGKVMMRQTALQYMSTSTSTLPNTPSFFTLNCVAGMNAGGAKQRILSSNNNGSNNMLLGWWMGFQRIAYFLGGALPTTHVADNNLQVYTAIGQDVSSVLLTRNRTDVFTADAACTISNGFGGAGATVDTNGTAWSEGSDCDFAEDIMWSTAISPADRDTLELNQLAYY